MGRKRKPTGQKVLEGNPGKRPLNENEPPTIEGGGDCPEELQGEAQAEWFRIVADMKELGVMSKEYRPALIMYCDTWAEFIRCRDAVKGMGLTVRSANGSTAKNPLLSVLSQLKKEARAWLVEFGMTPTSKSRLNMEPTKVTDDLDEYLKIADMG